jgi:hypothetical protein
VVHPIQTRKKGVVVFTYSSSIVNFLAHLEEKDMHFKCGPFALYGRKFGRLATGVGWFLIR